MSRPMPKIQLGSDLDFTNLSTVQPNFQSQISPNQDASLFGHSQFGRKSPFAPTLHDTLQVEDLNTNHLAVMNSGMFRNRGPTSSRLDLSQNPTHRSSIYNPLGLDEALASHGALNNINSARPAYRNSMDFSMAQQLHSARVPGGRDANRSVAATGVEQVMDKQTEVMDRILGNVEDYKKLEYMKKRVALEPLLGKSDAFSALMQSMRSQPQNQSQSHFLLHSPQTSLLHSPVPSGRIGDPSVMSISPNLMYTSPIHEPSNFVDILGESDIMDVENLDKNANSILRSLKPGLDPMKTRDPRQSIFERYNARSRGQPVKKSQFDILEHSHAGTDDSMMRTTRTLNPSTIMLQKGKSRELTGREMVKVYGWGLLFPHILANKAGVKLRKPSMKGMNRVQEADLTVPEYLKKWIAFAASAVEKEIKKLATSQDQMILVVGPEDKKSVNMEKSCKRITEHLMDIIDNLTVQLSNGRLSPEFYWYWASMTENEGVLPEPCLAGFEVDRLTFGNSGDLRQMNRQKSKLALATFILIRGLLTFLIMRPWVAIPSLQENNVNFNNMLNAGSVLYHAVLEVIEDNVQKTDGPKGAIRAQQPIFSAVDPSNTSRVDAMPDNNADDEQEIVSGFFKKDYLLGYFKERPKMLKKLKESIVDFLDVFYTRTHKMYECKRLGK